MTPEERFKLKLECVRLAAEEAFSDQAALSDEVFLRATELYVMALDSGLFEFELEPETRPEIPEVKEPKPIVYDGPTKTCPKCKESVPEAWPKHRFKANGEECGHIF